MNNTFTDTGISTPPNRPLHYSSDSIIHLEPNFIEQNTIDQFRLYDEMIDRWLSCIEYPIKDEDGSVKYPEIPRVFAPPERAFARMKEIINKNKQQYYTRIEGADHIPLPFISVDRKDPEYDGSRKSTPILRFFKFSNDCLTVRQTPYPEPYNIQYQIEIWTRTKTIANYIVQWLLLQFSGNVLILGLDLREFDLDAYPKPIETRVENMGLVNNTDIETAEDQRVIRYTLTINVRGYLFRPIRTVKTIQKIIVDVNEKNTNTNLLNVEIDSSDVKEASCPESVSNPNRIN